MGVENSERIARIVSGLRAGGGTTLSCSAGDGLRAERIVSTIHGKRYLDYLQRSDGQDDDQGTVSAGFAAPGLAQDTPLVPGAWHMARAAAAATVRAAELAVQDGVNTYAVVRPPGHHAGPTWHGGYCFINNAVVAARTLQQEGLSTVAIVDIDYHLGNGTYACVAGDASIRYFSLHSNRSIDFPYRFPDDPGVLGISADPAPDRYLALLARVLSILHDLRPDALVISIGYDILRGDPHGSWSLLPEVFNSIGAALADEGLPTVFVQEGGYCLPLLHQAAQALAKGIAV